jgi:hypothetical protein
LHVSAKVRSDPCQCLPRRDPLGRGVRSPGEARRADEEGRLAGAPLLAVDVSTEW